MRSPERLRYQHPGEWDALLDLDRCPCPRTLRRRTRYVEDSEGLRAWIGALAQHWCADDPEAFATLFMDGHMQVYSGKVRLPKHFVPSQKLALPAATGYWVHALGGPPLLCLHRQVDSSIVSEIWNGIVPQLQQMGLLAEGGMREDEPRLTLVFKRDGWSPRLIPRARALYADEDLGLELDAVVYALDSSTVDLCLSVFRWATFRATRAAVKLQTLLDLGETQKQLTPFWVS